MSIAKKALEDITVADIAGLTAASDPLRVAVLDRWSREEAAAALCSLANADGGLLVVQSAATAADLQAAIDDLGPAGAHLARAKTLGGAGVVSVIAAPAPPVLVETRGAIFTRTAAGATQVLSRASLESLLARERSLRQQAERNIEGMIDRLAFGHHNYMSVAVIAAPRVISDAPYQAAVANQAGVLSLGFVSERGLSAAGVTVRPGELEISNLTDVTPLVRVSRNGAVAVGDRLKRPAQDLYLSPAELSRQLSAMADAAATLVAGAPGPIVSTLFLEGVRDLRLPVASGTTGPARKDLVREFVAERYLADASERRALAADICRAASQVFDADLVAGAGAASAADGAGRIQAHNWHGQTKRTERRLAGLRGHGSGR